MDLNTFAVTVGAIVSVATLVNALLLKIYSSRIEFLCKKIDYLKEKIDKMEEEIRDHLEEISKLKEDINWLLNRRA